MSLSAIHYVISLHKVFIESGDKSHTTLILEERFTFYFNIFIQDNKISKVVHLFSFIGWGHEKRNRDNSQLCVDLEIPNKYSLNRQLVRMKIKLESPDLISV